MTLDTIFARLDALGCAPRWTGHAKLAARCPAHEDRAPSLSVYVADAGRGARVWWKCHAGCPHAAVAAALALDGPVRPIGGTVPMSSGPIGWCARPWRRVTDGRAMPGAARLAEDRPASAGPWQHAASYAYEDAGARLLAIVDRFECFSPTGQRLAKSFRPRLVTADRAHPWRHALDGALLPLYRLPDLLDRPHGASVIVVEGEKDALALAAQGFAATTAPGGAQGWRALHADQLVALTASTEAVTLWPDSDAAGAHWLATVQRTLADRRPLRIVRPSALPVAA